MDATTATTKAADDKKLATNQQDVEGGATLYDDTSSLGKDDILQQEHTDPVLNAKMHLVNNAMFVSLSLPLPQANYAKATKSDGHHTTGSSSSSTASATPSTRSSSSSNLSLPRPRPSNSTPATRTA
jgi:hypothetical protein